MTRWSTFTLLSAALVVSVSATTAGAIGDRGRVHARLHAGTRPAVHRPPVRLHGQLWAGPDNPIAWRDNRPGWRLRPHAEADIAVG